MRSAIFHRAPTAPQNAAIVEHKLNFMESLLQYFEAAIKQQVSSYQGRITFGLTSLSYSPTNCDIGNPQPHVGPGLTSIVRLRVYNQVVQDIPMYYALKDHHTSTDVLDSINIDFAMLFLNLSYPILHISGCEAPKHLDIIAVSSVVQTQDSQNTISLKGLRQCFDLEKGFFNVETYLKLANAARENDYREFTGNTVAYMKKNNLQGMCRVDKPAITWEGEKQLKCPVFVSRQQFESLLPRAEVIDEENNESRPTYK